MSEKLMSIVVLSWNRLHYTKQTVNRIVEATHLPHEIILVDNNSYEESGVRNFLDGVQGNKCTKDIVRVYNSKNLGVAGGRNSGLVKAQGNYLVTIDDDVWVPDDWDVLMAQACDRIPKLGITGVNVESRDYPLAQMNGVRVRPKYSGNLGGACLCLPKRVFKRVGYYYSFGQYGLEDSEMFWRLSGLNLIGAYIEPRGKHLDVDADKAYRKEKDKAHKKGSLQLQMLTPRIRHIKSGGDLYVPYMPYDPDHDKPELVRFTNEMIKKDRCE